jgi:8-oxo-dGTP pyrophosphatase MutT (NUDIX family)
VPADDLPPPLPAATVVVVREGSDGPEVLLLKRSSVGVFADMWVFPGGRVDDGDRGGDELSRARSAAVREAEEEVGLALDPADLVPFSHWTPPAVLPKRYTTWFFVAPWGGDDVEVDGHEIVGYDWMPAAVALETARPLAPPTYVTLHRLAEYPSIAELAANPPEVERFVTRPSSDGSVPVMLWEGDAGYDTGDASLDGARHRMRMGPDGALSYERTSS